MSQVSVPFTFFDPSGAPLANGRVELLLSADISSATNGGIQVAAKRAVSENLDNSGSATVLLWPNSSLSPAGTVYFVTAYSSTGLPAWRGELLV